MTKSKQDSAPAELPPLPEPLEIDWPTLNHNALGCGVEDRGIRDRYDAAAYGWQDGMDRAAERVPDAIYDADQMREYGRLCTALAAAPASPQPVAKVLSDSEIKMVAYGHRIGSEVAVKFARAILAAASTPTTHPDVTKEKLTEKK